jgi:hypothetical protein
VPKVKNGTVNLKMECILDRMLSKMLTTQTKVTQAKTSSTLLWSPTQPWAIKWSMTRKELRPLSWM